MNVTLLQGTAAALLLTFLGGCDNGNAATYQDPHDASAPKKAVEEAERVERAVARFASIGRSGVTGVLTFEQDGEAVHLTGEIEGLTPGLHGFHVHEFGDLTDLEEGQSAGSHYAPDGAPHGRPTDEQRHKGDLGNIEADENGVAKIDLRDRHLELNGPHSIIGRSVVVHAEEDKFTQPVGDAGGRVAIGVIGIAEAKD